MVLESLTNAWNAESHPRVMLLHGFLYATLGVFFSNWIFEDHPSLVLVFLTTMAAIPIVYNIIKVEEKKDLTNIDEKNLLREHSKALKVFMNYFIGVTIAIAFWYVVLPTSMTSNLFEVQTQTITRIRSNVTGQVYSLSNIFFDILSNNINVLIFCVVFSFIFGIGAIFILTWNASVIGVAIGDTIKSGFYQIGNEINLINSPQYVSVVSYGLLRYSIHGFLEILAYFVAGLAGGIISSAVIRHDFGTKKYEKIILDSAVLLLISVVMIVVSAFLEVYVTPMFF
jgi:uncharacterized membrane protein SpoIIM required for sporulation